MYTSFDDLKLNSQDDLKELWMQLLAADTPLILIVGDETTQSMQVHINTSIISKQKVIEVFKNLIHEMKVKKQTENN